MIPQERVNEAAKKYATATATAGGEFDVLDLQEFAATDFTAGVSFAEAELQPKPTTSAEAKQRLFDYFAQEHEINLMSSDFNEIEEYMRPEVQQTIQEFSTYMDENHGVFIPSWIVDNFIKERI